MCYRKHTLLANVVEAGLHVKLIHRKLFRHGALVSSARGCSPRPMSAGTLRDVARRAGFSEMTVSRVLRNSGYTAPATRERVLRAASEIGYVPNRVAGSLARQRTNLVGVLVPSMTNQVYPEVLSGVAKGLEGASLQPVFGVTGYAPRVEEGLIRDMISWRPSGIAVAGLRHTVAAREMLRSTSIPVAEMMDTDGRVV